MRPTPIPTYRFDPFFGLDEPVLYTYLEKKKSKTNQGTKHI
jgi:hypothetical protein